MRKIICNKVYDTTTSTVIKKVTEGYYGDPAGYEETLYQTPEGYYFLYTNGGAESPYTVEKIERYSKARADEFINSDLI